MRTELDQRMDAMMAALTGAGRPARARHGRADRASTLPMIAAAPPTLPAYFAHYCQPSMPTPTFLVAGDERLTFAEVHAQARRGRARRWSAARRRRGRPGRHRDAQLAVRGSRSTWASLMAGGVATLLNGWWQAEELAAAIADVDCSLVFADAPRAKRLAAIDGLAAPVVDDRRSRAARARRWRRARRRARRDAARARPRTISRRSCSPRGSTGQSKGALSDHRAVVQGVFNYLAQALMMLGIADARTATPPSGQPATLLNVPLFHVTAEVPVFLQSFAMGRKLVLMPKWDAEEAMRLIERGEGHLFRRRAADELRDPDPSRARATTTCRPSPTSPPAARRARSSMSAGSTRRWAAARR